MSIRLADKTLSQLIAPQGHACSCGKVHTCGLKVRCPRRWRPWA